MSYLNDNHGIDAILHIDGENATILLPSNTTRKNIVNGIN